VAAPATVARVPVQAQALFRKGNNLEVNNPHGLSAALGLDLSNFLTFIMTIFLEIVTLWIDGKGVGVELSQGHAWLGRETAECVWVL
jgi:hypothetical protein